MMDPMTVSAIACTLLGVVMVAAALLGHRLGGGGFFWRAKPKDEKTGDVQSEELATGTIDAAVLSLLGLLTAFTFSGAYSRYEYRRQLIVQEANAIGTAYLRIDLLPAAAQPALRAKFREYAQSRYDLWGKLPDPAAREAELDRCAALQSEIWSAAVTATAEETHGETRRLLLPALNEMIDITTTRYMAMQAHPPLLIYYSLAALAVLASGTAGFGMSRAKRPSYPHIVGFAIVSALTLYLTLDIEFPRFGLVTLDATHQLLLEVRKQMD